MQLNTELFLIISFVERSVDVFSVPVLRNCVRIQS